MSIDIKGLKNIATRQYRHNTDNSPDMFNPQEGFVIAYDKEAIDTALESWQAATALQAERVAALEAQRTAYLNGKCVCPHSTAGSAEHYPGCPQRQAERVRELEEALNGLLSVISETRGAPAHDAVQAALKALSATAREAG